MRKVFTVLSCTLALSGCATSGTSNPAEPVQFSPLDQVTVALPAGFIKSDMQGIDSEVARFDSADAVVVFDRGLHGAQASAALNGAEPFKALTGQTFDRGRVSQGMEGYPHGIILSERRAAHSASVSTAEIPGISISVFCRTEVRCQQVGKAIEASLRISK